MDVFLIAQEGFILRDVLDCAFAAARHDGAVDAGFRRNLPPGAVRGCVFIDSDLLDAVESLFHPGAPPGVFIGGLFPVEFPDFDEGHGFPGCEDAGRDAVEEGGVLVGEGGRLEYGLLPGGNVFQGDLPGGRAAVVEAQVGVGGAHDVFVVPVRPGGGFHGDAPLGVVLVTGVAAVRQGLDGDAELAVIGVGRGAGQRGAVALRAAQDEPSAVRVLLHDALAEGGGRFPESLDGLDFLPLVSGKHVALIGGDDALVPRAFGDDGLVPLDAAFLDEGFVPGLLGGDVHRPDGGVPFIGVDLDGSALGEGFPAGVPGEPCRGEVGDGQLVGRACKFQHAVPGAGDAFDVPQGVPGDFHLGVKRAFRNDGPGPGGHGVDLPGGQVKRLGGTVPLDDFDEGRGIVRTGGHVRLEELSEGNAPARDPVAAGRRVPRNALEEEGAARGLVDLDGPGGSIVADGHAHGSGETDLDGAVDIPRIRKRGVGHPGRVVPGGGAANVDGPFAHAAIRRAAKADAPGIVPVPVGAAFIAWIVAGLAWSVFLGGGSTAGAGG